MVYFIPYIIGDNNLNNPFLNININIIMDYCRNFGKELVILFHRTAAAPWGQVVFIIKRNSTEDSLSLLVPLPTLLAQVLFVAAP